MQFIPTAIPDVVVIEPTVFGDDRGFFMETWREDQFHEHIGSYTFVQDNHSKSNANVLRGLHYQLQQTQGKLVRVTAGAVFDVAVDCRRSSATFGQWVGETLSADNKKQLWVPPGFAHGFYTLEDNTEFVYKCTDYYAPEHERCLLWNDPDLNIAWPILEEQQPALSTKDAAGLPLNQADTFA